MMKLRKRIRLHLTTGRSVDGVLVSRRSKVFELADASVEVDGKLVNLTERVFVPRERVEFAQSVSAS